VSALSIVRTEAVEQFCGFARVGRQKGRTVRLVRDASLEGTDEIVRVRSLRRFDDSLRIGAGPPYATFPWPILRTADSRLTYPTVPRRPLTVVTVRFAYPH